MTLTLPYLTRRVGAYMLVYMHSMHNTCIAPVAGSLALNLSFLAVYLQTYLAIYHVVVHPSDYHYVDIPMYLFGDATYILYDITQSDHTITCQWCLFSSW